MWTAEAPAANLPARASKARARLRKILTAPSIVLIRFYRRFISPALPPSCRFTPSCSQYALEALGRYGVVKGWYLAIRRLLRCHPFHPGGYDPLV